MFKNKCKKKLEKNVWLNRDLRRRIDGEKEKKRQKKQKGYGIYRKLKWKYSINQLKQQSLEMMIEKGNKS